MTILNNINNTNIQEIESFVQYRDESINKLITIQKIIDTIYKTHDDEILLNQWIEESKDWSLCILNLDQFITETLENEKENICLEMTQNFKMKSKFKGYHLKITRF